MSQFPADWQFYEDSEYLSFHRVPLEDTGTWVNVLAPFRASGRSGGAFRLHIMGSESLSVRFPLRKIMHDLPVELANLQAQLSTTIDGATPQANTTATTWEDAEDLYKRKDLLLFTQQGEPAPERDVLSYFRLPSSDKSCIGASLRWAVAGAPDGGMQMELQSMPCQARFLTKPNLKADNSVSVLVAAFKVRVNMFDSFTHAGPVPLIFTPDRAATAAAFQQFPATLSDDIATINAHFLRMERLSLAEAVAYLQKGKARKGAGTPAFQIPAAMISTATPLSKKARYQDVPVSETGTLFFYVNYLTLLYVCAYMLSLVTYIYPDQLLLNNYVNCLIVYTVYTQLPHTY